MLKAFLIYILGVCVCVCVCVCASVFYRENCEELHRRKF